MYGIDRRFAPSGYVGDSARKFRPIAQFFNRKRAETGFEGPWPVCRHPQSLVIPNGRRPSLGSMALRILESEDRIEGTILDRRL